jgi:c(7)-type cytochrome triheme protein
MIWGTLSSLLLCVVLCFFMPPYGFAAEIKDVTYRFRGTSAVTFSHVKHLEVSWLTDNCLACHDKIYKTNGKRPVSMSQMEHGASCGACHNSKKAFALAQCGRCHPTRDVVIQVPPSDKVIFSHKAHEGSTKCPDCHTGLYAYGYGNKAVGMEGMARGKSCGSCHGKRAFPLTACGRCHSSKYEVAFPVPYPTGPVTFSHELHTKEEPCAACHPGLFKRGRNRPASMAQMEKGKSCGACHNGREQFALADCSRCHLAGDIEMKIKGAPTAFFSHERHISRYRCTDCHPAIFRLGYVKPRGVTMIEMDRGKSCGACHDDAVAFNTRFNCHRCHNM